jgi:hypothetical protein
MIRREEAQFEFGAGGGGGRGGGRKFQVGSGWTMDRLNFHVNLEMAMDFETVLDAVNADNLFGGINPVEDAVVADAELAEFAKSSGIPTSRRCTMPAALSASHWILRSTPAPMAVSSPASCVSALPPISTW